MRIPPRHLQPDYPNEEEKVAMKPEEPKGRKFKCRDMIEHSDGRGSLGKIGQLTALVVSSGCFIWMAYSDTMTEFYFVGYMVAWSGANIAAKVADRSRGRTRRDRHDHDDDREY